MSRPGLDLGVWLYPASPAPVLVDAVVAAEAAGLDEVWIADEGVMREPMVVLAAAAARTRRIRLGVGITSPALRHPGAIAASAMTLDELSGGRVVLGLGVGGSQSLDPFGLRVDRPLVLLRDAIATVRAVTRGEDGAGYTVPPFAAPPRPIPIVVASRGPRINRLASAVADGVFLSGFPPEGHDEVVAWARSVRPIDVALYLSTRARARPGPADPTLVVGGVAAVTEALVAVGRRHRPRSLGLALLDDGPLVPLVERAAEALRFAGEELTPARSDDAPATRPSTP